MMHVCAYTCYVCVHVYACICVRACICMCVCVQAQGLADNGDPVETLHPKAAF